MKMNETKYSEKIFAFLDILGFERIVNESRNNPELVSKIANILVRSKKIALSSLDLKPTVLQVDPSQYMYRAFSDTSVISGPYVSHDDMSFISSWIMFNQYYMWKEEQTFIRGAIVYGDIYEDKDIIFGPALIDAYHATISGSISASASLARWGHGAMGGTITMDVSDVTIGVSISANAGRYGPVGGTVTIYYLTIIPEDEPITQAHFSAEPDGMITFIRRGNTPVGTDVEVTATDPETGEPTPVTMTFSEVTIGGDTTVNTSSTGPPLPTSFKLGSPPTYFDITTTADYEPPVIVCIDYSGITFHKDESELRLLQKTETGWIDVTLLPVDTTNDIICGEVVSLSWFTVAEPNYPPMAEAGGPYTSFEGSPTTLDGSGSSDPDGTIIAYEWDLDGDGLYDDATGAIPSYTWIDDYNGNIGLKVTDDDGAIDTDTTTVTINNVAPIVDAGDDQVVNEGDTVTLDPADFPDSGSLDNHTAIIDWGDGTIEAGTVDELGGSGTVSSSHAYGDNGMYTVTVTVSDDDGGVDSDTLTVMANNVAPTNVTLTVDAGPDGEAECGLEPVYFTGSCTDPGWLDTHTYSWQFGDGNSDDGVSISHIYTECGIFIVTLTVEDDDGAVSIATATVTVVDTTLPEVEIEIPAEN